MNYQEIADRLYEKWLEKTLPRRQFFLDGQYYIQVDRHKNKCRITVTMCEKRKPKQSEWETRRPREFRERRYVSRNPSRTQFMAGATHLLLLAEKHSIKVGLTSMVSI